jgi:hypothetical protein
MGKGLVLTGRRGTADWIDSNALEVMQKAVGGSIEGVYSGEYCDVYANEEGMLLNLEQNESAAYFLFDVLRDKRLHLIYGPVFVSFRGRGGGAIAFKRKAESWFDDYKSGKLGQEPPSDDDEPTEAENKKVTKKANIQSKEGKEEEEEQSESEEEEDEIQQEDKKKEKRKMVEKPKPKAVKNTKKEEEALEEKGEIQQEDKKKEKRKMVEKPKPKAVKKTKNEEEEVQQKTTKKKAGATKT